MMRTSRRVAFVPLAQRCRWQPARFCQIIRTKQNLYLQSQSAFSSAAADSNLTSPDEAAIPTVATRLAAELPASQNNAQIEAQFPTAIVEETMVGHGRASPAFAPNFRHQCLPHLLSS